MLQRGREHTLDLLPALGIHRWTVGKAVTGECNQEQDTKS
jgi:hypothetical protein